MRVAAAVLVALVLVAACSGAPGASPGPSVGPAVVLVDCDAFDTAAGVPVERELAVSADEGFDVVLCSNPSTGFAWEEPVVDGDPILTLLGRRSLEPAGGALGEAGREVFSFLTVGSGTTVVMFMYSQPWAGGTKGEWRLDLTVTAA